MQNTRRQRRRDETQDEIVSLAWEQLAQGGTEALSLRGISREMRMSSSALFRYFPNREALLEELNRQAYHEQNRCMLEAVEILPQEAHVARLQAASLAYRAWALLNPHKFVLIYGSPLRGFDPTCGIFIQEAQRGLELIAGLLERAFEAEELYLSKAEKELTPLVRDQMQNITRIRKYMYPLAVLATAIAGWTRLHGIVTLEVFGHLSPLLPDAEAFYRQELQRMLRGLGFRGVL